KHLPDLSIHDALLVGPARVARDDPPPEIHGIRITQILGNFPAPGEAVQNELYRHPSDPQPAARPGNKELRHPVIDPLLRKAWGHPGHHCEPDRLGSLEDDQREYIRVSEPALDLVRLTMTHLAQHREDPGIRGKIVEIIAVDTL